MKVKCSHTAGQAA